MGIGAKTAKKAAKGTARLAAAIRKQAGKKKKVLETEGARIDPETGGRVSAARQVESGQAGQVTRGKKSTVGGVVAESTSKGTKARAQTMVALEKKIKAGNATDAEKKRYRTMVIKDELDLSRAQQAAGQTRKAQKPAGRTDYVDPESGEIVGKPTKRQVEAAMRNARARNMKPREREYRAFLEKEYGVDFNKGGKVTKRAIGAHDFRMNKGGLLLSSVDNRKKR
jgi:hypothetical protein